jgi:hypothetical protein
MYTHIDALGFTEYDGATVATRTDTVIRSQTPPWRRLAYVWLPIRSRAFDLFLIYMPLNSTNTGNRALWHIRTSEAERDAYSVSRYESRTHRPHVLHWRLFAQRVWRRAPRTRANDDDALIDDSGTGNPGTESHSVRNKIVCLLQAWPRRSWTTIPPWKSTVPRFIFHEDDKYAPMTLEQFRASIRNVHAHIPMPNRIDAKKLHDVYE